MLETKWLLKALPQNKYAPLSSGVPALLKRKDIYQCTPIFQLRGKKQVINIR